MNMQASALHDVLSYEEFHEKKNEFIKVAGTYLHPSELEWLYNKKQYILRYKNIYQINYSRNHKGNFHVQLLYKAENALTKRGCFDYASAEQVNRRLGFKLLSEEIY